MRQIALGKAEANMQTEIIGYVGMEIDGHWQQFPIDEANRPVIRQVIGQRYVWGGPLPIYTTENWAVGITPLNPWK